MKNISVIIGIVGAIALCAWFVGCTEQEPSREHIPLLRQQLYKLQEAVAAKNASAIDSILSVDALPLGMTSDSLLKLVYGPEDNFPFLLFGDAEILYTNEKARIDCFIMDSTSGHDRPLTVTLVYQHSLWLLKRFEPTTSSMFENDSL